MDDDTRSQKHQIGDGHLPCRQPLDACAYAQGFQMVKRGSGGKDVTIPADADDGNGDSCAQAEGL